MRGRCTIIWGDDLHDGKNNKKIHHGLVRRPPFSGNTQQPINSWRGSGGEKIGDETRGDWSIWEGVVPSFGVMICRMG